MSNQNMYAELELGLAVSAEHACVLEYSHCDGLMCPSLGQTSYVQHYFENSLTHKRLSILSHRFLLPRDHCSHDRSLIQVPRSGSTLP